MMSSDRIYFWRETEVPHGFLCQYYPSTFSDPSIHPTHMFNCAEQYMMYRKALVVGGSQDGIILPADTSRELKQLADKVLSEPEPAKQKYLLRSVDFSPAQGKIWERIKVEIVIAGNLCKFRQNPKLFDQLLATGTQRLVEASPIDRVWGIGFAAEEADDNEHRWGMNLLGLALQDVRDVLQAERDAKDSSGS